MAITVGHRLLQQEPSDERRNVLAVHLGRLDTYATSATLLTVLSQVLFLALFLETLEPQAASSPRASCLPSAWRWWRWSSPGRSSPPSRAQARPPRGPDPADLRLAPDALAPVRRAVEGLVAPSCACSRCLTKSLRPGACWRPRSPARGRARAGPGRSGAGAHRERARVPGADAVEVMTPRTEMHAVASRTASRPRCRPHSSTAAPGSRSTRTRSTRSLARSPSSTRRARASREPRGGGPALAPPPPFLVPETKLLAELLGAAAAPREDGHRRRRVRRHDRTRDPDRRPARAGRRDPRGRRGRRDRAPARGGAWSPGLAARHRGERGAGARPAGGGGLETVAGFVLARLGRFPRAGESFEEGPLAFEVLEASDRRVLRVRVDRPA